MRCSWQSRRIQSVHDDQTAWQMKVKEKGANVRNRALCSSLLYLSLRKCDASDFTLLREMVSEIHVHGREEGSSAYFGFVSDARAQPHILLDVW